MTLNEALAIAVMPSKGPAAVKLCVMAAWLGIPESSLYQMCEGRMAIPLNVLIQVTMLSKNPIIIQTLARMLGGEFQAVSADGKEGSLIRAVAEFGDVMKAVGSGATKVERLREIREARQALADLEAKELVS
jgi:hypothetical protein